MPCDYSKYPKNWKTKIRPDILERAGHKCEQCGVPNYKYIFRGYLDNIEVYQDSDLNFFKADNSELIDRFHCEDVKPLKSGDINQKAIKVVLTISHTDHNIENNDYRNLKALCQRCHNRHDAQYRANNRKSVSHGEDLFR
jgi:5-methylcytosine-specific restriction endonuclease McrA